MVYELHWIESVDCYEKRLLSIEEEPYSSPDSHILGEEPKKADGVPYEHKEECHLCGVEGVDG